MLKYPATLFCVLLIAYAFRLDRKMSRGLSLGLWIPTIWLIVVSSRPISHWLGVTGESTVEAIETGSPIDRLVFTLLLIAALCCLAFRKVQWRELIWNNKFILILFALAAVSLLWSDYPQVSLKRWIRGAVALASVMVVVTERDQFRGLLAVMRRTVFLLIPLSVLFAKYYRDIGVLFGYWGGTHIVGVTNNKNTLGRLCLVALLYFTFVILYRKWANRNTTGFKESGHLAPSLQLNAIPVSFSLLYTTMAAWLLLQANSATALGTSVLGVSLLVVGAVRPWSVNGLRLLVFGLLPVLALALSLGDSLAKAAEFLGRDPTLTGRTDLWDDLIDLRGNLLVGTGYGSFWIGERLQALWIQPKYWWLPTTAHNGYLEMFLQLGAFGLVALFGCILEVYAKARRTLEKSQIQGSFHVAFFIVFLFYNFTESGTFLDSMMWFLFMLFGLQFQYARGLLTARPSGEFGKVPRRRGRAVPA